MRQQSTQQSTRRNGFSIIGLLLTVAFLLGVFLLCGWIDVERRTPLEHLDRLFGVDVFQDAHDSLTGAAKDTTKAVRKKGGKVLDDLEEMGEGAVDEAEQLNKKAVDHVRRTRKRMEETRRIKDDVRRKVERSGREAQHKVRKLAEPMGEITAEEQEALDEIIERESEK